MDKEFENGWKVASSMVGAMARNQADFAYVQNVQNEIDKLYNDLMAIKAPTQADNINGGNMAEAYHAGTFNVKAAVQESAHRAERLGSTEYGSVDIGTNFGKSYSSKYIADATKTENAQATLHRDTRQPLYDGQDSLVPSDQLEGIKQRAHNKSLSDARPEMRESHARVEQTATDRISDGEGVESTPLSKKESTELSREVKEDKLDLEKRGITTEQQIEMKNILGRSFKASMLGATISAALATTPDIVGMIAKLIKSGEMNVYDLKNVGSKCAKSGVDGFVKGSLASFYTQLCLSGKLGPDLKNVNPSIVSSLVVITIETVKNSILLAQGKITAREMGGKLIDTSITTFAFLGAMKLGGMIGQSIAPQLPVVGFLIGSLIGCGCCAVYQIGKKCLISFCEDSGFTCFGLVEQDYSLPDEALKDMGVDLAKIQMANVQRANIQYANIKGANTNSIQLKMIRRGVFSLNKIGYVYQ